MKKYLLCALCLLLFLTACGSNIKPTESISAAPSGAAEASTSAPEAESSEEIMSSEMAKETTLPTTVPETTTFAGSTEEESIAETESSPVSSHERKEVIVDLNIQETLSPPPGVKEVFRTQNETFFKPSLAEGDTLHLRELDTRGSTNEPGCFAVLSETEVIIADTVARYFKLFRDGKCVRNYFMQPGLDAIDMEIDEDTFYYYDYQPGTLETEAIRRVFRVDLQTGIEQEISHADSKETTCTNLLWMDGQLILVNGYIPLGSEEPNYYLDMEQNAFLPTSKGFQNRWEYSYVYTENITWHFDEESMDWSTRIFPEYVDKRDNLYVRIEEYDESYRNVITLCKYSPEGELIWRINASDPNQVRRSPGCVKYCRDGKIYFMIIWEDETVIYQIQEEIW